MNPVRIEIEIDDDDPANIMARYLSMHLSWNEAYAKLKCLGMERDEILKDLGRPHEDDWE